MGSGKELDISVRIQRLQHLGGTVIRTLTSSFRKKSLLKLYYIIARK